MLVHLATPLEYGRSSTNLEDSSGPSFESGPDLQLALAPARTRSAKNPNLVCHGFSGPLQNFVYIYMYTYIYTYIYICVCICSYVETDTYVYIYMHMHIDMCVCVVIFVPPWACNGNGSQLKLPTPTPFSPSPLGLQTLSPAKRLQRLLQTEGQTRHPKCSLESPNTIFRTTSPLNPKP